MANYEPIPGSKIFNALNNADSIVMAVNPRMAVGVVKGIFRAAKELDAALIFELAKSESDLKGGYTGLTPADHARIVKVAAKEIGFDIWALHADHTTIKKGTREEIEDTKKLIDAQIKAGYTSFAIDASFLFDSNGKTPEEELKRNIDVTTELAKYIKSHMKGKEFGLEVEVGEIGKTDKHGRVLTTPEEAVAYIKALNKNGVYPQAIAIANGSVHGNTYDANGNPVEQVSIDIPQTIRIGKALEKAGLHVRIVQHGITGTPRELICTKFPKKAIVKGNVATFWQDMVWDTLKVFNPVLYSDIHSWVMSTYGKEAAEKGITNEKQVFGTYSKKAIGARDKNGKFLFFDRIYKSDKDTVNAIESRAYSEALMFFRAFNAKGSAKIVRKTL
ncbi:MAG: class II fructose-bisphosphate aldolase [Candidatus Aenigmarchaeota archaeon]|nr:class II fructose-bisphosphate aldolase [Candidatus Aenigmarchaeota archaeon]